MTHSKKLKSYTFELIVPKGFKNDWILVKARNPKSAKKKLLKECSKLNERFMHVREFNNNNNNNNRGKK